MGVAQDFAQGAEDLRRLTGLRVSKERLRQITESEADRVAEMHAAGTLRPSWLATEATVPSNGISRVYVVVTGVMVRTVTQAEKDRRRRNHLLGNTKSRLMPKFMATPPLRGWGSR